MQLTPLYDYILVEILPAEQIQTDQGIFLPSLRTLGTKAKVLKTGAGRVSDGVFQPIDSHISPDAKVLLNPYAPVIDTENHEIKLVLATDILAIIDE